MEPNINYSYLIPHYLNPVLEKLDGRLKDLFTLRLLPLEDKMGIEVTILALEIILTTSTNSASFKNLNERFFTNFLNEINFEVKSTLEKVLEITKKGLLEQFFNKIDSKKKNYYSNQQVIEIANEFYSQTESYLKEEQIDKVNNQKVEIDLSLSQAYHSFMLCKNYFALPKLIDQFLKSLPIHQKWQKETYDYFFNLLNTEYQLKFDDFEKVEITKSIFRLHFPSEQQAFKNCSIVDLKEFISFCFQLKNQGGEELLQCYFNFLKTNKNPSINEMINALKLFLSQLDSKNIFLVIEKWKAKNLNWQRFIFMLEDPSFADSLNDHFF